MAEWQVTITIHIDDPDYDNAEGARHIVNTALLDLSGYDMFSDFTIDNIGRHPDR